MFGVSVVGSWGGGVFRRTLWVKGEDGLRISQKICDLSLVEKVVTLFILWHASPTREGEAGIRERLGKGHI